MSGTAAGMSETSGFQPDARLAADSVFVADGPLSQVRLMDDSRFPWLVLVPRVADVSEWIDLDGGQQRLLLAEINQLSQLLRLEPGVAKLNIGALGNIVRQLHVHLVGRHPGDAAWPGPVWGSGSAQRFEADALHQHVAAWAQRLR
ncbi:HIT family protein [Xanthomonas arboricola]|uniref:Diadenosine tetraphosphate hydrolase n=1 Tax=Xanthomonas arboricola pv. guizotiae TaxID=487867 RepID=A0A2S6ZYM8_9XANT|nr:diadenosine tetraphosphate hydrolase [Xanthomonas arboricola pv. guizotiae]PPU25035.1 diadenosine tetraphosphate hydrolase [Xanthomonas arboricola pv. guizotiae]